MPTIQQIAQDFSSRFEGAVRADGTEYRRVKESAKSEALTQLIMEAHGDRLPDDWCYQFIEDALYAIAESVEDAQLNPSIYTHELTDWLNSRADRYAYCDEGASEFGFTDREGRFMGTVELLQLGMAQEQAEVLASVLHSLQQLAEEE